jgi:SAM-dependent methyltransferase
MSSRLEELVLTLSPAAVLDVGCGCGRHLTRQLAQPGRRIVGVDRFPQRAAWREAAVADGTFFCRMDARALAFADGAFPLVLERASLHHVERWPEALSEMLRVSRGHVLLEEPVDDLRSAAKRRSWEAQGLYLKLQAEVGYPHHRHLEPDALLSALKDRGRPLEVRLEKHDEPVAFDEYFQAFSVFTTHSKRQDYWQAQLEELRARFAGAPLCEDDTLTVLAVKITEEPRRSAS